MSRRKTGPKMAKIRPEEQSYLARWRGVKSAPTVWEKIDNDPVYEQAVKQRYDELHQDSLGQSWGKSRGPK